MKKYFAHLFFFALLSSVAFFCFPLPAFASSGASFLKLGVGARAAALGSAYTALANDVTALHWNPAGLSHIRKKEIGAMHAELFSDTHYDFIGYAQPTTLGTFGFGAFYLSQGAIEGRGENREQAGDFTASDLALTLGGSRYIAHRTTLGASLKLLQSKLAAYSSTGFALDLGSVIHLSSLFSYPLPMSLGFAIRNIGPQMKFIEEGYNLPLTMAGGAGVTITKGLLVSADLKFQPYDSRTSFSLGTEFSPVSMFSLRAGYITNTVRPTNTINNSFNEKVSNLSGLGLGLGFRIGSGTVDYSFSPAGDLGNSQRISVAARF